MLDWGAVEQPLFIRAFPSTFTRVSGSALLYQVHLLLEAFLYRGDFILAYLCGLFIFELQDRKRVQTQIGLAVSVFKVRAPGVRKPHEATDDDEWKAEWIE